MTELARIISGGQTGVDRAALDLAIDLGIPHGGWCPRGRRAEDGRIAPQYRLRQTRSSRYAPRTRRNILDADATLILHAGQVTGGTALTLRLANELGKRLLVVDVSHAPDAGAVRAWLETEGVRVLNVAGPRESTSPGIGQAAYAFLRTVLTSNCLTPPAR